MSILKQLMEQRKLKNVDVANYVDVTEGTVRAWKGGRSKPKSGHLEKLAEMLGTTPSKLMFGQEGMKTTNSELKSLLDEIATFLEAHPKEIKRFKRINDALMKGTE